MLCISNVNAKNLVFAGLWSVLSEVVAALQHAEISIRRQWLIDAVEISCVSSFPSTVGNLTLISLLQFVGE